MSRRLTWVAMGLVLIGALFLGSRGRSGPPTVAQRVHRIASVIKCPTCQGLSAAQSDAPASEAIRDEIQRRVEAGQSDGEIKAYLVSRYTSSILLSPQHRGLGLLVWLLPLVGGAAAVGGLVFALRRNRIRPGRRVSAADQALVAQALHE
jgi:cytochrome c-type biogenesis protein CcmH